MATAYLKWGCRRPSVTTPRRRVATAHMSCRMWTGSSCLAWPSSRRCTAGTMVSTCPTAGRPCPSTAAAAWAWVTRRTASSHPPARGPPTTCSRFSWHRSCGRTTIPWQGRPQRQQANSQHQRLAPAPRPLPRPAQSRSSRSAAPAGRAVQAVPAAPRPKGTAAAAVVAAAAAAEAAARPRSARGRQRTQVAAARAGAVRSAKRRGRSVGQPPRREATLQQGEQRQPVVEQHREEVMGVGRPQRPRSQTTRHRPCTPR
mmetsp:Transcript_99557/g.277134  ORF Transcript_99557/g.277134 Transcript_99557/m.277134 type:complete len:258 (-) Transcript_99557:829-1602(-)